MRFARIEEESEPQRTKKSNGKCSKEKRTRGLEFGLSLAILGTPFPEDWEHQLNEMQLTWACSLNIPPM